jgi:hypothetical protein
MTDPRNIAHDKKVQQEKKKHHQEGKPGATHAVQPGKKPHLEPAEKKPLEQVEITPPPDDTPKPDEQMQG